jgi:hypothetical protein
MVARCDHERRRRSECIANAKPCRDGVTLAQSHAEIATTESTFASTSGKTFYREEDLQQDQGNI